MKKKNFFFIVFTELMSLFFAKKIYQLLVINCPRYLSIFISINIIMILNYLVYNKILYKKHFQIKRFIQFYIIFAMCFILKYFIQYILINDQQCSLLFVKIISCFVYVFSVFNFKLALFVSGDNYVSKLKNNYKRISDIWNGLIAKKYIKNVFKFLPHNIYLFCFLISVIVFLSFFATNNYGKEIYVNGDYSSNIGPMINKKVEINFKNIAIKHNSSEKTNRICIPFGTYNRVNNSDLKFTLIGVADKVIYTKKINTKKLQDGKKYCIALKPTKLKDLKRYKLVISTSKNNRNNNITIFTSKDNQIAYSINYVKKIISLKYMVILFLILSYLLINYLINKYNKKLKIYHFFLLLLLYIIPVCIITPPFEVPDEFVHFKMSYTLSQQGLNGFRPHLLKVPKNINCLNYSNNGTVDYVDSLQPIKKCLKQKSNYSTESIFNVGNVLNISFIGYVISAAALKIADIFTNSPLFIFYFGRLGNLLFSIFVIYRILKMVPKHKKIFMLVIASPMFIQQMISYSYDSILNTLSLLLIAYYIAIIEKKMKFNFQLKIKIIIILLFLLCIKTVYLPLFILLLLIPSEFYGTFKKKILFFVGVLLLLIGCKLFIDKILIYNSTHVISASGPNNFKYIIDNPLNIFNIIRNTIRFKTIFYLRGLVGYFSWFTFYINDFTVISYFCLFLYLCLGEKSVLRNIKRDKVILILDFLLMFSAIFGTMYICWSKYKLNYVEGVQGRYFIPLMSVLALILIPKQKKYVTDNKFLYWYINILLFEYVLYIILKFY